MNIFRLVRTISAHGYGQIVTVISTLLIPAAIVAKFGPEGFGYWISLSALSQFFVMADFGASIALQNQLCLKIARTQADAWSLIRAVLLNYIRNVSISVIAIIIISLSLWFYYDRENINGHAIQLALTFFSLALSAVLQPVLGVYCAVWRFNGRNEVGIFITNTVRLIEISIIAALISFGSNLYVAAITVLIFRIIISAIIIFHIPKLVFEKSQISIENNEKVIMELKSVNHAGYGFMMISFSQQFALYGPILVISTMLGPAQAAIFAACRTLSRLPVQPLTILLASLNPEMTELIANNKHKQMMLIVRRILFPTITTSIIIGILAVFNVDRIENIWLAGKLNLELKILIPLCIAATFYLSGQVINQALTSSNQTRYQSKQFMLISTSLIIIMIPLILFTKESMSGAILVAVAEAVTASLLFKKLAVFK